MYPLGTVNQFPEEFVVGGTVKVSGAPFVLRMGVDAPPETGGFAFVLPTKPGVVVATLGVAVPGLVLAEIVGTVVPVCALPAAPPENTPGGMLPEPCIVS